MFHVPASSDGGRCGGGEAEVGGGVSGGGIGGDTRFGGTELSTVSPRID